MLASFGDALITARLEPGALRSRLHELSRTLPEHSAWDVLAAARDPFAFLDRALDRVGLTGQEAGRLKVGSLAPDCASFAVGGKTIDVPTHVRGLLGAHRDIRVAEGSTPSRPFCIPTDDRTRPHSRVR